MDFPTRSARERATHYEQEAEKFHRMAAAETVERVRAQLFALAKQYQQMAAALKSGRPLVGDPN